jgi:hypothetical protein
LVGGQVDLNAMLIDELLANFLQCGAQTQKPQLRGMQLVGHVVNIGSKFIELSQKAAYLGMLCPRFRWDLLVHQTQANSQQRQPLSHVVVQLAGDPLFLLLLGRDQTRREFLEF